MRKFIKHKSALLLFTAGALCFGALSASAQSPIDKIKGVFAKEDDGSLKPHETLEAPFSTDGQVDAPTTKKNKNSLMFLYDQELTGSKDGNILSKPHRTDAQISEWVQIVVTNLMSFDYKTAQDHINKYQGLFDRPALIQYVNEMNKSDIVKAMRQNGLVSVAMFDEMPVVINKGNFEGVYRWLFDFPVKITFRYTGKNARKNASEHTIVMQVKMRVGRSPSTKGADGGIIESWTMERIE